MSTVATPVLTWSASLHSGSGIAASTIMSAILAITQGWEARVPIRVFYASQVSNDVVVSVFPTRDGGANYDTIVMTSFSIARTVSAAVQQSIVLPGPGIYQIQVLNSGPNVGSLQIPTFEIVTAYLGA